jgi:hypothetical protein
MVKPIDRKPTIPGMTPQPNRPTGKMPLAGGEERLKHLLGAADRLKDPAKMFNAYLAIAKAEITGGAPDRGLKVLYKKAAVTAELLTTNRDIVDASIKIAEISISQGKLIEARVILASATSYLDETNPAHAQRLQTIAQLLARLGR